MKGMKRKRITFTKDMLNLTLNAS